MKCKECGHKCKIMLISPIRINEPRINKTLKGKIAKKQTNKRKRCLHVFYKC